MLLFPIYKSRESISNELTGELSASHKDREGRKQDAEQVKDVTLCTTDEKEEHL